MKIGLQSAVPLLGRRPKLMCRQSFAVARQATAAQFSAPPTRKRALAGPAHPPKCTIAVPRPPLHPSCTDVEIEPADATLMRLKLNFFRSECHRLSVNDMDEKERRSAWSWLWRKIMQNQMTPPAAVREAGTLVPQPMSLADTADCWADEACSTDDSCSTSLDTSVSSIPSRSTWSDL